MNDHRFGNPALAAFIADQHEPERKSHRTPERVRLSAYQECVRRGEDMRTTAALKPPALAPMGYAGVKRALDCPGHEVLQQVAELKTVIAVEWDELAMGYGKGIPETIISEQKMLREHTHSQAQLYAAGMEQLKRNIEKANEQLMGHAVDALQHANRAPDDPAWIPSTNGLDRHPLSHLSIGTLKTIEMQVTFRGGGQSLWLPATAFSRWGHDGTGDDVVAYRTRKAKAVTEAPAKPDNLPMLDGITLYPNHVYEFERMSRTSVNHFSKWDGSAWFYMSLTASGAARQTMQSSTLGDASTASGWRCVANHGPADQQ